MIGQEQYIQNLLYEERMLLGNTTILWIKADLYIEDEKTTDNDQTNLKTY